MRKRTYKHRLTKTPNGSILAVTVLTLTLAFFTMLISNWLNSEDTIVVHAESLPVVTPSVSPTPTTAILTSETVETDIVVKVSHYNPELGGVNCANFQDGKCVSNLANGEPWEKYIDTKNVIACPKELKLGTKIKVLGRVWTCKDRGGKITKTESGAYWIDMLTRETVVAYGAEVEATIIK